MHGFPICLKLDCLMIMGPCPQSAPSDPPKPAVVSCPCTDIPLQNARLHFSSHQLLFQRPVLFFCFIFSYIFHFSGNAEKRSKSFIWN